LGPGKSLFWRGKIPCPLRRGIGVGDWIVAVMRDKGRTSQGGILQNSLLFSLFSGNLPAAYWAPSAWPS
jgi:hypothetical protein